VGGGLPLSLKRRPLSASPRRNAPPVAPPTGCHAREGGDPSLTARHPSRPSWPGEDPGMTIDGPNASAHRRAPPTGCHPSESRDPALTLRQRMNGSQPCARMTPADASHPVQNPISLTRGVTSIPRPHTPILAQLTHGTSDRAYTPFHCVLIERLETNGRGRRAGWCGGRLAPGGIERIVRAFPGPGSGAGDGHDRPSSRSGWADRRPIPSRAAPRQHSRQGHLAPLTVRAPGSRGGTKGPLLRRTNRLDPWSRLAAPLSGWARSIPKTREPHGRPVGAFVRIQNRLPPTRVNIGS